MYDLKQVNKAQHELLRLRAIVFRDFVKELHAQANAKVPFRVVFHKSDADQFEFKKTVLVSQSPTSSDKSGEYTLDLQRVSAVDVAFYASSMFENVNAPTSISCTSNVFPIVSRFAEKMFPELKVRSV